MARPLTAEDQAEADTRTAHEEAERSQVQTAQTNEGTVRSRADAALVDLRAIANTSGTLTTAQLSNRPVHPPTLRRRGLGGTMCDVRNVLAAALLAVTLTACQPTGSPRCDVNASILDEIEAHGWTVDCTPGFPNRGTDDGETWFPILGWADHARKTVWIWPDNITDGQIRKTLWHELGHVTRLTDETDAEIYAWCREPIDGVGYRLATLPTEDDCARVGA